MSYPSCGQLMGRYISGHLSSWTLIISYLLRTSSTDPSWTDESERSLSVLHICSLTRIDRKATMGDGQVHWWRHHPPQVHQFNGLQLGNSSRDDDDETGKVTLGLASSLWAPDEVGIAQMR